MKRAIALMTFAIVFVLGIVPYARVWSAPAIATRIDDDDTRQCSNATLKGSFGYTGTGNIVSGPFAGPFAAVGRNTFDGLGLVSYTQTASRNGVIFPNVTNVLPYTVNADCTGSLGSLYLVVDDNGKEFRTIVQNAGVVTTFIGRKISTRD